MNTYVYSNEIRNTNANETGNVPYAGLLCFRTWASCVIRARKGKNPNTSFCRNTFVCFILHMCNSHQILQISTLTRINMKRVFWIEREMEFGIHATELLSAGDFVIGSSIETTPVQLKIFKIKNYNNILKSFVIGSSIETTPVWLKIFKW